MWSNILLLTVLIHPSISCEPLAEGALNIQVLDVEKRKGTVIVAIFTSEESWLKRPYRELLLSTDKEVQTASFQVPFGRYAVPIYQDVNGNGELGTGLFGIPTEPVGSGNNYRPLGGPDFGSAVFEFSATSKSPEIKLDTVF